MKIKTYQIIRILVVFLLSLSISIALSYDNYFFPLVGMAIAMIILNIFRRNVREVLADERDYKMAGDSARYAISIFSIVLVAAMFVLMNYKEYNPYFADLATYIGILVCGLMLLNVLIFRFLKMREESKAGQNMKQTLMKNWNFFLLLIFLCFLVVTSVFRFLSPEDSWLCDNGVWTRHGNPENPMPEESCEAIK